METAHENRCFDHRGFGTIEALKRRMCNGAQHATVKVRPLFVLSDVRDGEFCVGKRTGKTRDRNLVTRCRRPLAAPRDATGEDANIIGEIRDRERKSVQVIERRRRAEWRNDPAVTLRDDAQRRKVNPPRPIDRRNDGFPDHRHQVIASRRAKCARLQPGA